jgi:anti-anti-sigma factor
MAELDPGQGPQLQVTVSRAGGATVVSLVGELDLANSDQLEQDLKEVVAAVEDRLVIDASRLRFADTSAIALWVKWREAVPAIEVRSPPPAIRRVIETMGLAEVLCLT